MTFIKSLFTNKATIRAGIKRYVDIEFRPNEREYMYNLLIRENNL